MTDQRRTQKTQARTEAQRERILQAAQTCFLEHGFHAAGMAAIADAAGMSAGLIYRYFSSKREIILAIIERQLELARAEIGELRGSTDLPRNMWKVIMARTADAEHRMKPALHVETSAEATRDPVIAGAVSVSDRILREDLARWLSQPRDQGGLGLTPERAASAALVLQCLADGLRLRTVREPGLDRALVKLALEDLFSDWPTGN